MKVKNIFPDQLRGKWDRNYKHLERFDGGSSYNQDFRKATKYAKRIKGQVYTVVDRPGTRVAYLKGLHIVDRLGFVVVGGKK
jgi:hypothetical protein